MEELKYGLRVLRAGDKFGFGFGGVDTLWDSGEGGLASGGGGGGGVDMIYRIEAKSDPNSSGRSNSKWEH